MPVVAHPLDAVGGVPQYAAQDIRTSDSVLYGAGSGRPLGARSGLRVGTSPVLSLSGNSWQIGRHSGVIDPGVQQFAGPYNYAVTGVESGTVNPSQTNPRIDAVYLRVKDNAIDVSGAAVATVEYVPGTPASSPTRPTLMTDGATPLTQGFVFGWITTPATGGGASSVQQNRRFTAGAGGVLPVSDISDYPAATAELARSGLLIYDIALDAHLKCTGTAWKRIVPLNQIQGGVTSVTTNGSGNGTIAFPTAFDATPASVVASPAVGNGGFSSVRIGTISPSAFDYGTRDNNGNPMLSANLLISWLAFGPMS